MSKIFLSHAKTFGCSYLVCKNMQYYVIFFPVGCLEYRAYTSYVYECKDLFCYLFVGYAEEITPETRLLFTSSLKENMHQVWVTSWSNWKRTSEWRKYHTSPITVRRLEIPAQRRKYHGLNIMESQLGIRS